MKITNLPTNYPKLTLSILIFLTLLAISQVIFLVRNWKKPKPIPQTCLCISCENETVPKKFFQRWRVESGICYACLANKLHREAIIAKKENE